MGCGTSSLSVRELSKDDTTTEDDTDTENATDTEKDTDSEDVASLDGETGIINLFERNLQRAKRDVVSNVENGTMGENTQNLLIEILKYHYVNKLIPKNTELVGDWLARDGVAGFFKAYFDIYFQKIIEDSTLNDEDMKDFKKLLGVCVNYSDASSLFAESIAKSEILLNLLQYLKLFKNTFTQDQTQGYIVLQAITILYNCSIPSNNTKYYKESGAVELIGWYAENTKDVSVYGDNTKLSTIGMLTLAHISDKDDNDVIETDDTIINYMVEDLNDALHRSNRRSAACWSAKELALGLTKLANNNKNSKLILQSGALPYLMELIEKGDVEEQTIAVNCIWALSFVKENNIQINDVEKLLNKLKELKSHEDRQLREAASGVLWLLRNQSEPSAVAGSATQPLGEATSQNRKKTHLMLSYSWAHQTLIKQIKTHLESHGYNVWMDVDRMGGSTLQAMADAVEESAVVLICMSQKYKDSPNCRLESDYAYQLHKDIIPIRVEPGYSPNGWLGMILGSKFIYDVTQLNDVVTVMPKLVRELGDRGKKAKGEISSQTQIDGTTVVAHKNSPNSWTAEEVQEWAKRHGLKQSTYETLDGETLSFLKSLKSEAPEFFYCTINKKLGLEELKDVMLFINALNDLK